MYEDFRKIKKLESPEDWKDWKMEIEIQCGIAGWDHLFDTHKTKPENTVHFPEGSDSEGEYFHKVEIWLQQQDLACSHIKRTLGYHARLLAKDKQTVSEMMDAIEKQYSYSYLHPSHKTTILMQLMNEFNDLSLMDCDNDVRKFTNKLFEIREDMLLLDESCSLMEPFWINKLLDNLGLDFKIFTTTFRSESNYFPEKDENGVITKKAITFMEAVQQALRVEGIVKLMRKNPCEHCGRKGHLVESCWELHPHKRPLKRRRN
ncbi:gag-pol polyprotein [Fusarium flagelliforme]|uniref:Gag-pol polyprotein n=1 Tax=Fusarium flagelliforme TaxID=2675880 RepID=A0A395MQU2_9HYPO|nr:gag-pol polyprotein [Fusarium flagelliforme]